MTKQAGGAPRAVVLVSGGLDSCVVAALAVAQGGAAFLHLDYGQRTMARERRAFLALADHFGLPPARRLLAATGVLAAAGGSALLAGGGGRGAVSPGLPETYVPFRNAHLLAAGVSWAEVLGAGEVHIGAVANDQPGYPDCREEFLAAFEQAARLGTGRPEIAVRAPLVRLDKAEIVRRGLKLQAPFHLTWSCYAAEDRPCGECPACRRREEAFRRAGAADPVQGR